MKDFTTITKYYDNNIVNHVSTIEYDIQKKRLAAENAAYKKRERYDNALDAASIVTKYAKNSNKHIDQIVDRINVVRNNKNKKDVKKDASKKQINK